jgi:hypothetical protein
MPLLRRLVGAQGDSFEMPAEERLPGSTASLLNDWVGALRIVLLPA